MIGRHNATQMGTGRNRGIWPVLALILAAVLVPTACVLWFMNAAMRNERLAVRESIIGFYRRNLEKDQQEIADRWSAIHTHMPDPWINYPVAEFGKEKAEALRRSMAIFEFVDILRWWKDGVVLLDNSGLPCYPSLPSSEEKAAFSDSSALERAQSLEFEQGRYEDAAREYSAAAQEAGERKPDLWAQALLANARCLARAGKTQEAIDILLERLSDYRLVRAQNPFGRSIWFGGQLLALQLMDRKDERFVPLARLLSEALNAKEARGGIGPKEKEFSNLPSPLVGSAYDRWVQMGVPSSQRLFIMESLQEMRIEGVELPSLPALRLATEYISSRQPAPIASAVTKTNIPGVWQMGSPKLGMAFLLRQDKLIADLKAACRLNDSVSPRAFKRIELPDQPVADKALIVSVPLSENFPGWRLAYYFDGRDPFAAETAQQNAAYLWTGVLGIALIAVLAAALASYLGRQMRLTRLKNDLIATVSHELKTPLASMRVLVDTLREGRCTDDKQAGEYFDLIARENQRLSRLIDNFLTFSRMERNKRAFDFDDVDVGEVVRAAAAAVTERFSAPGSKLSVDVAPDLPPVRADRDAVETVILNLLDNAWKYSGDEKLVAIRAAADGDGAVRIEVSDNGVGMSRRAQRRIFDKFYQVDQTLSRRGGGCGLGLAIVKFILDAHGGTIRVRSAPGKGSTFTVRLPPGKKEKFNAEIAETAEE